LDPGEPAEGIIVVALDYRHAMCGQARKDRVHVIDSEVKCAANIAASRAFIAIATVARTPPCVHDLNGNAIKARNGNFWFFHA
jgi:hypothetical protein